jgi:hypothetical protein
MAVVGVATAAAAPDDARVMDAVEALSIDEKGAVLGLALGAGADAAARLAGDAGARCQAALVALAALDDEARAAKVAALAVEVAAPLPAGIERVHPGWLRRALDGERSEVVRAVASGQAAAVREAAEELLRAREEISPSLWARASGPALAELQRALFGGLVPMPAGAGGQARMPRAHALCALSATALADEIDRRGAETLGVALAGAPAEALARAAAGAEGLARVVVAAAQSGASDGARAAARALVSSVPAEQAARGAVRAVGLRAVARDMAAEGVAALMAVAQVLPLALGDALLACGGTS